MKRTCVRPCGHKLSIEYPGLLGPLDALLDWRKTTRWFKSYLADEDCIQCGWKADAKKDLQRLAEDAMERQGRIDAGLE